MCVMTCEMLSSMVTLDLWLSMSSVCVCVCVCVCVSPSVIISLCSGLFLCTVMQYIGFVGVLFSA